jgi:serine/threonine-protein kinase
MTVPLRFGSASDSTSLTGDFLDGLSRRAMIAALTLAGVWTLVAILVNLTMILGGRDFVVHRAWDAFGNPLTATVVVASLLTAWAAKRLAHRPELLLRLVLGYEVLSAAGVAIISQWNPPLPSRGISWNCLLILIFPTIAPARPKLNLFTSLIVASADPLVYWLALRAGVADPPLPGFMAFWAFAPAYICAGLAVVPATIVRRLGAAVKQARELGNYHLGERLGAGAMGEVYRASHRLLARPAAIKLMSPMQLGARDPEGQALMAERFRREAGAAASLRSPHTIGLYDFGQTADGTLYYAMEMLDGIDLQTLVDRHGPLPPARAAHLLRQACRSLAEAHRRGFVHRDIKPSNLMLCRMGTEVDYLKVLDFGLVQVRTVDQRLTAPDVTAGTPAYMAPEAIDGVAAVDHRADLYALGCVAYWLISGRQVFRGASVIAVMMQHSRHAPPPLTSPHGPICHALESIVMRCLAKDPAERPADALEIERVLAGCAGSWSGDQATEWWRIHLPESEPERAEAA